MIRFILLCTVFFSLYIGFMSISEFDSKMHFSVRNYEIETTAFFFASIFLMIQLILMIILRCIFLLFDLPAIIKKKWLKRKLQHINAKLLRAVSELLMNRHDGAVDIIRKILPDIEDENKDLKHLITAYREANLENKIHHLRTLVDKKHFSIYAAKALAEIFFQNGNYAEAEKYAIKAFNENDTNTDLMLILLHIYAKLSNWPRMVFIVSKLQRADSKLLEANANDIASYYYKAARSSLDQDEDAEAMKLLQSSLELKPDYIEALNLYIELNVTKQNTSNIVKILNAAFRAKPSFEIALMLIKSSNNSANSIYESLAEIIKPSDNATLFLTIAAYLDLSDKIKEIKEIKEVKLISHSML